MLRVKRQISSAMHKLKGKIVLPPVNYEKTFCKRLGWDCVSHRYYDAKSGGKCIEIKKGQHGMTFDLVRYAEIYTGKGQQNTMTVFMKWSKERTPHVSECYIIDTKKLIKLLKITKKESYLFMRLNEKFSRGLRIHTFVPAKGLKRIATFVVKR